MKVVVFHRARKSSNPPALLSNPWDFWGNFHNNSIDMKLIRRRLLEPMANQKISLNQPTSDTLCIRFEFSFYGKKVDHSINVRLTPWTYLSFWYRDGLERVDVLNEDYNRHNAMTASLCHEFADLAGALGRIVLLDDCALLYLRGTIDNVPKFENFIVNPHEHSTWAFGRYSPKAKFFLEEIQRRRDSAQQWCLVDKIIELENEIKALKAQLALREDQ